MRKIRDQLCFQTLTVHHRVYRLLEAVSHLVHGLGHLQTFAGQ